MQLPSAVGTSQKTFTNLILETTTLFLLLESCRELFLFIFKFMDFLLQNIIFFNWSFISKFSERVIQLLAVIRALPSFFFYFKESHFGIYFVTHNKHLKKKNEFHRSRQTTGELIVVRYDQIQTNSFWPFSIILPGNEITTTNQT